MLDLVEAPRFGAQLEQSVRGPGPGQEGAIVRGLHILVGAQIRVIWVGAIPTFIEKIKSPSV